MTRFFFPFAFVFSILIAFVSIRWLFSPVDLVMEHMLHYLRDVPLPAYLHIAFGPLALAVLPFQFWRSLRMRRPRLHRALGYTYVVSILLAGAGSLLLLPYFQGTLWAGSGFAVLAILWIGFTARAVLAARQRDFRAHEAWMMRSGALTFAAVTLRIIMAPLMASGWTVVETYNVTAWGSWVPVLLWVEWRIRRRT